MTVYGYCRVSTERQAKEGVSIDTQKKEIFYYCRNANLEDPVYVIDKGISGAMPFSLRPNGGPLLDKLKPGDHIVALKLDRMFRRIIDAHDVAEELKKRGVSLHLKDLGGNVMGGQTSELLFSIMSAFSQFERDRIKERIREVKATQKDEGRYLGGRVPVGYRVKDGYLVEDPTGQEILTFIRDNKGKSGSYTLAKKIKEKFGVTISHNTVYRIGKGAGNA